MKELKAQILYDHYKDTFAYLREYLKRRDKLFSLVVVVLTMMFLQITSLVDSTKLASKYISIKLGFTISLSRDFFDSLLWFVLFSFVLKYYQATILIERQYDYIHKIEEHLTTCLKKKLIYREGSAYLKNYPLFSSWAHFVYTKIFPLLLIIVVLVKIISEIKVCERIEISILLNVMFAIMILISVLLSTSNILEKVIYRLKKFL